MDELSALDFAAAGRGCGFCANGGGGGGGCVLSRAAPAGPGAREGCAAVEDFVLNAEAAAAAAAAGFACAVGVAAPVDAAADFVVGVDDKVIAAAGV